MRRLKLVLGAICFIGLSAGIGIYGGLQLSDYDILCEKDYNFHALKRDFYNEGGIFLPKGTVVSLRECKPNIDVRLEFFIDNWNHEHIKKLPKDSFPAYYLGFGDDFGGK